MVVSGIQLSIVDPQTPKLVPLTTARTEFEAETFASILREAGIQVSVFSIAQRTMHWQGGPTAGVPVMVQASDFDRAAAILRMNRRESYAIDWSQVDLGEPENPDDSFHSRDKRRPGGGVRSWATLRRVGFGILGIVTMASWVPARSLPLFLGVALLVFGIIGLRERSMRSRVTFR